LGQQFLKQLLVHKFLKYFGFFLFSIIFYGCSNNQNNAEFIKKASGRFLYNSDEVIKIYFKENELFMEWRGAKNIKPLKINENVFFVKEMNEKIQFLTNPKDKQIYISLVHKEKNKPVGYNFRKLRDSEKVPSEFLKNNEFKKALEGYIAIKERDSLDTAIQEGNFNSLGYKKLRKKNYKEAIQVFKINVTLYPNSSNVYDSLAEAFMKSGDTLQAIANYEKSLTLDSNNSRAKKYIKKLSHHIK